jgi:hypothetical protein
MNEYGASMLRRWSDLVVGLGVSAGPRNAESEGLGSSTSIHAQKTIQIRTGERLTGGPPDAEESVRLIR